MAINQLNNYMPGQNLTDLANNVDYNRLGDDKTQISVSFAASPATVTVKIGSMWELNGNGYDIDTADETFVMANAAHNYITYNETTGFSSAATIGTWSPVKQGFYQADNVTRTLHWYIEAETETALKQQADEYTGELKSLHGITDALSGIFGTDEMLNDIAWGNGLYCVVGDGGKIFTSPDGLIWTSQTSGTSDRLRGVAYGAGIFCAVGGSNDAYTSPDGVTWTAQAGGYIGNRLIYADSLFVALQYTAGIYTSADGITWTNRFNAAIMYDLTYSEDLDLFCMVGTAGALYTSPDGITWTSRTSGTSETLRAVGWYNGLFFALGDNETAIYSTDGTTWSDGGSGTLVYDYGSGGGGAGLFICNNQISITGKGWFPYTGVAVNAVLYHNGFYYIVAEKSISRGRYLA